VTTGWTSGGKGGSEYWSHAATMTVAHTTTQRCIVPILCSGFRKVSGRLS
jgi:hypothetical protein